MVHHTANELRKMQAGETRAREQAERERDAERLRADRAEQAQRDLERELRNLRQRLTVAEAASASILSAS